MRITRKPSASHKSRPPREMSTYLLLVDKWASHKGVKGISSSLFFLSIHYKYYIRNYMEKRKQGVFNFGLGKMVELTSALQVD